MPAASLFHYMVRLRNGMAPVVAEHRKIAGSMQRTYTVAPRREPDLTIYKYSTSLRSRSGRGSLFGLVDLSRRLIGLLARYDLMTWPFSRARLKRSPSVNAGPSTRGSQRVADFNLDVYAEILALVDAIRRFGRELTDPESHPVVTSKFDMHALRRTPPNDTAPFADSPPVIRILTRSAETNLEPRSRSYSPSERLTLSPFRTDPDRDRRTTSHPHRGTSSISPLTSHTCRNPQHVSVGTLPFRTPSRPTPVRTRTVRRSDRWAPSTR